MKFIFTGVLFVKELGKESDAVIHMKQVSKRYKTATKKRIANNVNASHLNTLNHSILSMTLFNTEPAW